jgi:hypothetical protein
MDAVTAPLSVWESFYVIVGSSGAALTGLQFVVMALIADSHVEGTLQEVDAFGTPTVVHFCAVLYLAAVLSAPWPTLTAAAAAVAVCGAAGILYTAIVIRRARHTPRYKPVFEDWLWHAVLPLVAYVTVLASAVALPGTSSPSLFFVAGASLLLLFIGIHNAWDTVTYVAIQPPSPPNPPSQD